MPALWIGGNAIGVDPGVRCGHHAKIQVIDHCVGIACLASGTANLLLDLLEAGLYLPACAIVLDDLLNAERQVSGKECNPAGLAEDPYHPHGAAQILQHQHPIIGPHLTFFP